MREYNKADQFLHLLCQVPAKFAANLLAENDDYSHTNLSFDPLSRRIYSRWMEVAGRQVCLALDPGKYTFEWLGPDLSTLSSVSIVKKTQTDIENALLFELPDQGYDQKELSIDLKYEIDQYPFADQPFESLSSNAIHSWLDFRTLANEFCSYFLKFLNVRGEVRIWPHHFDTGVYQEIGGALGFGFGLAMKDTISETPYFYLSANPLEGELNYDLLSKISHGSWCTGEWKGALLTLDKLSIPDHSHQIKIVREFIHTVYEQYWKMLN